MGTARELVLILAVLGWAVAACSSSAGEVCDSTDDCFAGEFCDDGICQSNDAPGNGDPDSGNGDPDSGSADADSGNGDPDSGSADTDSGNGEDVGEDACTPPSPCNPGVDSDALYSSSGLQIDAPEPHNAFGCPTTADEGEFVGGTPDPIEIFACPVDGDERVAISVRACDDRQFVVNVEIESVDEACPVEELTDMLTIQTSGFPECEGSGETDCYTILEAEDGHFSAQVIYGTETSHMTGSVATRLSAESGNAFPYKVSFEVTD